MNDNQPQFEKMPAHYLLCFNEECSQADTCLHCLAARSGQLKDDLVWAVNPAQCNGKSCRYYQKNQVVTMAYGMVNAFREVRACHITTMRNMLINHFGRTAYYQRRNGKRPITPSEQQYIANVFRKYGYTVQFGRTAEETQWE